MKTNEMHYSYLSSLFW